LYTFLSNTLNVCSSLHIHTKQQIKSQFNTC
jgi:hypothetical protein